MKIGYARVSTQTQNLNRQITALKKEGCQRIFQEKASGKNMERPQLLAAIKATRKGDILVVADWDRATRSLEDGFAIVTQLQKKGALLKVLDKPHLDLTTPMGRALLGVFAAVYEDERRRTFKNRS